MNTFPLYRGFADFLKLYFDCKIQKVSVNAGFTCPNRDGAKGLGGCTYCDNRAFNPEYCKTDKSVTRQLEDGKRFFSRKYPDMKYLAYFQAYTNTYAGIDELKRKYEEALNADGVVGLVIGTRPDCVPDSLLRYLEELNRNTFLTRWLNYNSAYLTCPIGLLLILFIYCSSVIALIFAIILVKKPIVCLA
jgi:radical SAM protein (TIGR01212 family)